MNKPIRILLMLAVLTTMVLMPSSAQDACIAEYEAGVDYFEHKVEITDADNLRVEYFNNYKVVTVLDAYDSAPEFHYVLVQCGTPAPDTADVPEGAQYIEVPAERIITLSTTQLPHLTELGLLDALVGVDSFLYVSSPDVQEMIEAEELTEVGFSSTINVEVVLDLEPDLVMTYGFNPDTDAHPVLTDAGVFTALNADWREPTPLGRAEWLKYTALFFNGEEAANDVYDNIVEQYNEAAELAASVPEDERPVVLWNTNFGDSWAIPGENTYIGALTRDAGGVIALSEQATEDVNLFSFETVYEGGLDADIWITNAFGVSTIEGLIGLDARYTDFAAVESGTAWNNDLDVNANGGNNYYELGVMSPHLILHDMVAIFHPDLLPDHEFRFHQRMSD